ncbi:MAG: transcription elongation factor GreA [Clostridia bacterium]|nr:transcription elongation factor GreA [Clostridia bacterium]
MEDLVVTQKGFDELKEKLEFLKTVKRQEVIDKINVAREFGDFSENAEYDAAKEEQTRIELEINDLEYKINNAVIVDSKSFDGKSICVGCYVKLYDEEFEEEVIYQIVGSSESDPVNGMISNVSPVGKALIGKLKGDEVKVDAPNGVMTFKVLDVSKKPFSK